MTFLQKTGTQRHVAFGFFITLWREKADDVSVKWFLERVFKKKKLNPVPLGSWWDIFTLQSIYKVGNSAPPGWNKQKCLCDEPEKTSSIRLYIFVSQLFTRTLKGVKTRPQPAARHTHGDATLPRSELSQACVSVFVRVSVFVSSAFQLLVQSWSLTSLVLVHTCFVSCKCPSLFFLFHSSQLTNEIPE